jgi:antitoxin (DNA-binding transcriptional repressor) of toxin-antitoxin stability system
MATLQDITCKKLHDETGKIVRAVKRGQKFRVSLDGKHSALIVPANENVDPSWEEIMAEVNQAREVIRAQGISLKPNPILEERKRRNYAARLRR